MVFDDLKELFNFDEYQVHTNILYPNITHNDSLLIAIHHSGDSGFITEKLHLNKLLTDLEIFYVESLTKLIEKLPKPTHRIIYRNEINDDAIIDKYRTEAKKCFQLNTPLIIPSFWNFTENKEWPINSELGWKVNLLEDSKSGVSHFHYPPLNKLKTDELEVIFPPNSKFEVTEYSENLIQLQELD